MKINAPGGCLAFDITRAHQLDTDISELLSQRRLEEVFNYDPSFPALGQEQSPAADDLEPEELDYREDGTGGVQEQPAGNFERDIVACYLKEIAKYPLLSREHEAELAQTLRDGQNRLVGLVARFAPQDGSIQSLHERTRRLLSREQTYPGVRDKALRLIQGTLSRLAHDDPSHWLYPKMAQEAETILSTMDTARQEMIKANLRLVLSIAKRYRGRGMSFEDLIQEGNLGLLTAAGRFDHTKGNRFCTYATHWVRQSILRSIYVKTRTIRLPVHFVELRNRFFKVFYELLKELGHEPTPQEIATRAGLSIDEIQQVMRLSAQPISLETPIGDHGHRLADLIEDPQTASPVNHCAHRELAEAIRNLLATLPPREKEIIRLRFGLEGQPAETLERIGQMYKVSKERIRQIEKKAMDKLRKLNRQDRLAECMD